jgi:hypothetical protein
MAKVKLGKDQTISIDGEVLEGTREVDVSFDLKTTEITSWDHQYASTLGTTFDATLKLVIYWKEDYDVLHPKLTAHPPAPLAVSISNVGTIYCLPMSVSITQPIAGVLGWEATLRMHSYNVA